MKDEKKLNIATGPPVSGSNFFGRKNELDYIWDMLKKGNNYKFPSPRRVGKTSFGLKLLEIARAEKWQTISINLEKIDSEADFIDALITELEKLSWWDRRKAEGGAFFDFLKRFRGLKGKGFGVEFELGYELIDKEINIYRELVNILDHDEPLLFLIDEVTVLLERIMKTENGEQRAEYFLHGLRALRQVNNSKVRWIFISSVGIENFVNRHNFSKTINDFATYELQPFTTEDTHKMILALEAGQNFGLTPEIRTAITNKIGYLLPFFIQLLFAQMHQLHKIKRRDATLALVDEAYQEVINGSDLNTWIERLVEQYGEYKILAEAILKMLCQKKEGLSRRDILHALPNVDSSEMELDTKLGNVLFMLKNDGYLSDFERRYTFRSPLLRDFWFNRYIY